MVNAETHVNATRSTYTIPDEFKSDLELVQPQSLQTDDEILTAASTYTPVTSEKNIWAFWDKGISSLPDWCKRNIIDWARINGPSWTIRLLDTVPGSPNNALNYVSKDSGLLPDCLINGTMDGAHIGPHSADLLRGACLQLYGGVWMDVGNILIRSLDRICWDTLADPSSPYNVCVRWAFDTCNGNFFVAARKDDPFVKRWHALFVHLWQGRTNAKGLALHPLLGFMMQLDHTQSQRRGFNWDMKAEQLDLLDYVTQISAWRRVCMLEDDDGFDGVEYHRRRILWVDVLEEDWAAENMVGYDQQRLFDLFRTRVDSDKDSEEYKTAYKMTWRLLTRSSLQKVIHGTGMMKKPALGTLWEMAEHNGADATPRTFGDLLRYGSVHFRQTREKLAIVDMGEPQMRLKGKLLEA